VIADPTDATTDTSAPPPDLGELIKRFGSYAAITPAVWADFDRAMAAYQAARREGLRSK
jgi:hypothetical protein